MWTSHIEQCKLAPLPCDALLNVRLARLPRKALANRQPASLEDSNNNNINNNQFAYCTGHVERLI